MRYRSLAYAALAAALLASGTVGLTQAKQRPSAPPPTGPQPIQRAAFIAQMDVQFGKMDTDKNGQLTRSEIEQSERERAMAEAKARNESLFDQLDVNRNGQISATEFAKLVTEPATVSAQPMLAREDLNRDGQISQVEHRTATLANFDRIDTDKDGVASVDEMKAGGIAPR